MAEVQWLRAGDFDGDGQIDVVGAQSSWEFYVSVAAGGESLPIEGLAPGERVWAPLGVLRGPSRARLLVGDVTVDAEGLTIVTFTGEGTIADDLALAPDTEVMKLRIADLDGDLDDDLLLVGRSEGRRVVRAWVADGEALLPGPVHDFEALTGWDDAVELGGLGVDDQGEDGDIEVIVGAAVGVARITGVQGPSPVVDFDDASLAPTNSSIPTLYAGDLDGDGERDLLRVTDTCEVLLGDGGHVSGTPEPVPLPAGTVVPAQLDDDGRLDFFVRGASGLGAMLTSTHARPKVTFDWSGTAVAEIDLVTADLDGDGRDELVVATTSGIATLWDAGSEDEHVEWIEIDAAIRVMATHGGDTVIFGPAYADGGFASMRWDGARLQVEPLEAPSLRADAPLKVGDLDGDGHADLVSATDAGLVVAFGIDDAHLEAPIVIGPAGARSIELGDLDLDGRLDVVSVGDGLVTLLWSRPERRWDQADVHARDAAFAGGDLYVRRDSALDRLDPQTLATQWIRAATEPGLADATRMLGGGDLDGDGRGDLVTIHPDRFVAWLSRDRELQHVTFSDVIDPPVLVDLDGDGRAELVVNHPEYGPVIRWGEEAP
ncbi:MAG: VCBS repeat-containing protein [Nannocystaceae bacterium]